MPRRLAPSSSRVRGLYTLSQRFAYLFVTEAGRSVAADKAVPRTLVGGSDSDAEPPVRGHADEDASSSASSASGFNESRIQKEEDEDVEDGQDDDDDDPHVFRAAQLAALARHQASFLQMLGGAGGPSGAGAKRVDKGKGNTKRIRAADEKEEEDDDDDEEDDDAGSSSDSGSDSTLASGEGFDEDDDFAGFGPFSEGENEDKEGATATPKPSKLPADRPVETVVFASSSGGRARGAEMSKADRKRFMVGLVSLRLRTSIDADAGADLHSRPSRPSFWTSRGLAVETQARAPPARSQSRQRTRTTSEFITLTVPGPV